MALTAWAEAQRALIGSLMLDPDLVSGELFQSAQSAHFGDPALRHIFEAARELWEANKPIDPVTVAAACGSEDYSKTIAEAMKATPTAVNYRAWIEICRSRSRIAALQTEAMKIVSAEVTEDGAMAAYERMGELLRGTEDVEDLSLTELIGDYLDRMNDSTPPNYLSWGMEKLDKVLAVSPGKFVILAADSSVGKTALALNMAANIAMNPSHPAAVGIFSLEMPALSLILRMICSESRVGLAEFRNKTINQSRWADVMRAASDLNKAKIVIDDTGAIDILELRAKARRMKAKHNVEAIFVDYLQLIRAHTKSNASRENEVSMIENAVSMISGSLKAMAKELNIPVVVLAQLNRQAEQGEKPKLSQLRESGAIEQDAYVVALLHREREKQHEQKDDDNSGLLSELIIAKNRNGATGTAELLFFPKYTRFENKANADSGDVPAGEF